LQFSEFTPTSAHTVIHDRNVFCQNIRQILFHCKITATLSV
jgi:hypothetical protein